MRICVLVTVVGLAACSETSNDVSGGGASSPADGGGGAAPSDGGSPSTDGGSALGGGGAGEVGGAPSGGAPSCAPVVEPGGETPGAAEPGVPQILASNQADHWGFAVDDTYLYWTNGVVPARVVRQPKSGGDVEIVSNEMTDPGPPALKDGYVYVGNADGTVRRVPAAGGCTETILDGYEAPFAIAVDDTDLYFGDFYTGVIGRLPKDGGTVTELATGQASPSEMILDDQYVYWANKAGNVIDQGSLMRVAKSGGDPEVLDSGLTVPRALLWHEGKIFYHDGDPETNKVLDAGTPTVLFNGGGTDYVSDGSRVLFGDVFPHKLKQFEPGTGVTDVVSLDERPFFFIADSEFLYWVNRDVGEVVRMLKP